MSHDERATATVDDVALHEVHMAELHLLAVINKTVDIISKHRALLSADDRAEFDETVAMLRGIGVICDTPS